MRLPAFAFLLLSFAHLASAQQVALQEIADEFVESGESPGLVLGLQTVAGFELAASGVRKFGEKTEITIDDQMHLGSCTKAFTAVLIARLVEQGKLRWDSTIAEVLPDVVEHIHSDYHDVTLTQLLRHTAGVSPDADNWWLSDGDNITQRRQLILQANLREKPIPKPGEKFAYSNLGYMIAGLMAARISESTWEEALQAQVLEPLGITTAGFGVPGKLGKTEQPWGHRKSEEGEWVPVQADNAPALGPAGTLYLTLADWNKFANVFINCPEGFLKPESIQRLVQRGKANYGLGWGVGVRRWARGATYTHAGSNTMWYANIWIAPEIDCVMMVAINHASEDAPEHADQLIGQMIDLLPKKAP